MTILRFPFQSLYATLNKPVEAERSAMVNYVNHLKLADIFNRLTQTQYEMIAEICHEESFRSNEVIYAEGAESNELYIIIQGKVEILVDPSLMSGDPQVSHAPVVVAKLKSGQSFGEIALVNHSLRSTMARASQNNTHLLVIPRQDLMKICDEFPQLGFRIMKNLAKHLADTLHHPSI